MNYKVPQFIEVEDKIFGPLTFKQFIYLAGGAGACFILWTFLPKLIAFFLIVGVGGFALALAFYRVNNRPFVILVESYLKYQLAGRLYLWRKEQKPRQALAPRLSDGQGTTAISIPKLSRGRLRDLAWSLDVNENINV
jgi:hypothetical protein